jgi:hypothetical protein
LFATGTIPRRRADGHRPSTLRRAGRISLRFRDAYTAARKRVLDDAVARPHGTPGLALAALRRNLRAHAPLAVQVRTRRRRVRTPLKAVTALDQEALLRALEEVAAAAGCA